MLRRTVVVCALVFAPPATGAARTPTLSSRDAGALAEARSALHGSLRALQAGAPTKRDLQTARRAMATIERALDVYFHSPDVVSARSQGVAAGLRAEVQPLWGGERPLVLLQGDVWHFQPEIHRTLAAAARMTGERAAEILHLREVQAVEGPSLADLTAIRAAYLALGKGTEAEAVGFEISASQTAELSEAPAVR